MKTSRVFVVLSILLVAAAAQAAPIPKLQGPVNDYAHVLSPDQQARLDSFLRDQEKKTSNQIVILTVKSLDGDSIEGYAVNVFQEWKLGQKGKDNGVLVVAAIGDRKMRIEVGKGLEGVLTDAISSQIIRNEIAPHFRSGDYAGGLWAGVTAIDKAIHGEYKAESDTASSLAIFLFAIIIILALAAFVRFSRYAQRQSGIPWWYTGRSWDGSSGWSGGSGGGWSGGSGGYSGGGGGSGGGGASGGW